MPIWWFVRHGESQAQTGHWTGPDHETPLSPLGEQQADALSPSLPHLPIQRVLVSPYLRARQTAERALAVPEKGPGTSASLRSPTPFQIVHDLRERFMGDEYRLRYHEPEVNRNLAIWDFRPPGGESVLDAAGRAIRCLANLDTGENTIIFAHGRILAGVLTILDGADPSAGVYPIDNCAPVMREVEAGHWGVLARGLA
jgi:broad specificity phosphatase PhoE